MVLTLLLFMAVLLGIGIYTGHRKNDYSTFVIAGHRQSWPFILLSLMATIIGGSATFGVVSTGYQLGFPAIWWLGVGSVGLVFQALFVSGKVRDLEVNTLAEAGNRLVGGGAGILISAIIAISWIGIIAGQFAALAQIFSFITGQTDNLILILISAAIVVLFTTIGGQLSVMRTDNVFFFFLFFGIVATFCFLFFGAPSADATEKVLSDIRLFQADFTPMNAIYLLFVVGGTYFIGPDVLSRSMTAKDTASARKASLSAAILLLFLNVLIIGIALWCRNGIADLENFHPLVYLMKYRLPTAISLLLALGLASALLSSASTCLITAAATIQNDLIRKESIAGTRVLIVLIGIFAAVISVRNSDIISILTGAYSIYAPGIVFPLFVAICNYKKRRIRQGLWLAAVAVGGACGIIGNFITFAYLPLIGMFLSLVISLFSLQQKTGELNF